MVLFYYVVMCLIFGTTFLAIKIGVESGIPPFMAAGLRFTVAGMLILIWMRMNRKISFAFLWKKELLFIGTGSTFLTFATLYWAEQHIDSGIAAILSATGPMMILFIQSLLLSKSPKRTELIGCIIGFAGVCLLLLPKLVIGWDLLWIGSCLLVLLGELGYAAGSILTRKAVLTMHEFSPIAINGAQMLYGGFILLLLSACMEQAPISVLFSWQSTGSLLYLILIGSMLGHSLYAWLLKATNAFFPSTWLYISPIIAMGLGALFYREQISVYSLLGSILVISGIVLPNLHELKKRWLRKTASSAA